MNNDSVVLSKPIDPAHAETIFQASRLAKESDVEFVLVGAFARNVHFEHVWNIPTRRGTTDIDLSVQVRDWSHYERLRQGIQHSAFFFPEKDRPERYTSKTGILLDLIPFGGVAEDGKVIFWPPNQDKMSVIGLADAFAHAVLLDVVTAAGEAKVSLTSIPGLVILKLVAIYDRTEERVKKDSDDIEFIMTNYLDAGNRIRLVSGQDKDLAQGQLLDIEVASARLLGRDMARMSSLLTRERIADILHREAMGSGSCPFTQQLRRLLSSAGGRFNRAREVVSAMLAGYTEG
jgi:predicted nucleotidyltransferase